MIEEEGERKWRKKDEEWWNGERESESERMQVGWMGCGWVCVDGWMMWMLGWTTLDNTEDKTQRERDQGTQPQASNIMPTKSTKSSTPAPSAKLPFATQ
jgi:hypothetical protein